MHDSARRRVDLAPVRGWLNLKGLLPFGSAQSAGLEVVVGAAERRSIGEEAHSRIGAEMWCVTKNDLKHLRKQVAKAIHDGEIQPTSSDDFDPCDNDIGPNVYTVVDQYLKRISRQADDLSWALMRHPKGIKCDLFITHAWQEGIFEFLDKVLTSWPRSAKHAWCCFLANPQNLDITSLIINPKESPFAKALASSSMMLVVPNCSSSIYTRLWCAYEAHIAYKDAKVITTARAPVLREVLVALALMPAFYVVGIIFAWFLRPRTVSPLLWWLPCVCSLFTIKRLSQLCHWWGAVATGYILCALALGSRIEWETVHGIEQLSMSITVAFYFAFAEVDRVHYIRAQLEANCLRNGYTEIANARCSDPVDDANIRAEIGDQVDSVDRSVRVLMDAGMSTPNLREAAERGVDVKGAGFFPYSLMIFGASFSTTKAPSHGWCRFLVSALGTVFVVAWLRQADDKRTFAVAALMKLGFVGFSVFGAVVILGLGCSITDFDPCRHAFDIYTSAYLILSWVAVIVLTLLGAGGVARIPLYGPALAQLIYLGSAGRFSSLCPSLSTRFHDCYNFVVGGLDRICVSARRCDSSQSDHGSCSDASEDEADAPRNWSPSSA